MDASMQGCCVLFLGSDTGRKKLESGLHRVGARIAKRFSKQVTHVVLYPSGVLTRAAKEAGDACKIVTSSWAVASVRQKKLLDASSFLVDASGVSKKKDLPKEQIPSSREYAVRRSKRARRPSRGATEAGDHAGEAETSEKRQKNSLPSKKTRKKVEIDAKLKKVKKSKRDDQESGASGTIRSQLVSMVDPLCPAPKGSQVLSRNEVVFKVMLNQTNINFNNNKFYNIEALQLPDGTYGVWNRWGRVGREGKGKLFPHGGDEDSAIEMFEKKFKDKTGNLWQDKEHFEKRDLKYDVVDIDFTVDRESVEEENKSKLGEVNKGNAKQQHGPEPDSTLPEAVQKLVSLICDIRLMQATMQDLEIDVGRMPLGKLTKDHIRRGYEVLNLMAKTMSGEGGTQSLQRLSSRFYTLIPHDFGMRVPPIIRTHGELVAKMRMLEVLGDIEIAQSIVSAKSENEPQNQLDLQYSLLKCKLDPLARGTPEFERIETYLRNTHGETHSFRMSIEDVFRAARTSETERAAKYSGVGNRRLLWHGSGISNYVGILSQGLRIAPKEAPMTGYMFGKGIYFADMVSKAGQYCRANSREYGLLMLCEVALGNQFRLKQSEYVTKLPKGMHSTWGVGETAPDYEKAVDVDGVLIPLGKPRKQQQGETALLYNEFIVYDVAQVEIKYLVWVKFKARYGK